MANPTNNIADFRPMLSGSLPSAKDDHVPTQEEVIKDLERLDWTAGFLVSPKIDGIRAIHHPIMGLVSRSLKSIPNRYIQTQLNHEGLNNLDGELVKGRVEDLWDFSSTQSMVMSADGASEFTYAVFDDITHHAAFSWRTNNADHRISSLIETIEPIMDGPKFHVIHVEQTHIYTIDELLAYEEVIVGLGYEGVMFRDPRGGYKHGRSTFRQQGLIKIKRFVDGEAEIIGFEELLRNRNESTIDALGYSKRSAHVAGKVSAGTLGKFLCRGINGRFTDVEFECGSGLNDDTRSKVWGNREAYLGKYIKYKYQDAGSKNKPRSPIFLGFRDRSDM